MKYTFEHIKFFGYISIIFGFLTYIDARDHDIPFHHFYFFMDRLVGGVGMFGGAVMLSLTKETK